MPHPLYKIIQFRRYKLIYHPPGYGKHRAWVKIGHGNTLSFAAVRTAIDKPLWDGGILFVSQCIHGKEAAFEQKAFGEIKHRFRLLYICRRANKRHVYWGEWGR